MSAEMSRELHWFLETLQENFGVIADTSEIGIEAVELGLEEVENFFVPQEVLHDLPKSLLYEIMVYEDEQNDKYVGGIAFHPNSPEWCLQAITKNGEIIYRKTFPLENT